MNIQELFENLFTEDEVRNRAKIKELQDRIAHIKENMKSQIYTHSFQEMQRESINKLEDEIKQLKGG